MADDKYHIKWCQVLSAIMKHQKSLGMSLEFGRTRISKCVRAALLFQLWAIHIDVLHIDVYCIYYYYYYTYGLYIDEYGSRRFWLRGWVRAVSHKRLCFYSGSGGCGFTVHPGHYRVTRVPRGTSTFTVLAWEYTNMLIDAFSLPVCQLTPSNSHISGSRFIQVWNRTSLSLSLMIHEWIYNVL